LWQYQPTNGDDMGFLALPPFNRSRMNVNDCELLVPHKGNNTMNKLLGVIGAVALLALAAGCMTTRQTEDLLVEAGFKKVPATTPEQQAHLKTMPTHKMTTVRRDGKQFYLYPDVRRQVLYVGQPAQYQEYQKLCQQYQAAVQQTDEEIMNAEAVRSAWGDWSD
jgi:hypothetical protein